MEVPRGGSPSIDRSGVVSGIVMHAVQLGNTLPGVSIAGLKLRRGLLSRFALNAFARKVVVRNLTRCCIPELLLNFNVNVSLLSWGRNSLDVEFGIVFANK